MADDIEARLSAAATALREHEITTQRCAEIERRLGEMDQALASLRADHQAELEDVERLEGLSLTRVLATLRGSRNDRLALERAQADAAALRVQDAEARLVAVRREHQAARARLQELAGAPAAYAAVLDEKEHHLRASDDPRWWRIMELADERGRLEGQLRELVEALQAAGAAHDALSVVQDHLGSASNWSTYDTFFGGGLISSGIKHSRLDDAAAAATQADRCLALLRTELADVGGASPTAAQLDFDDLTRFLDVWLDNIFTDWAVQRRIDQAHESVAACIGRVEKLRSRLEHTASVTRARLDIVAAERHDLLT